MDEIAQNLSLDQLNIFLQNMRRLEVWGVNQTAGNNLSLDIGDVHGVVIQHKVRGEIELEFGEWVIDSMGSAIRLVRGGEVLFSAEHGSSIYSDWLEPVYQIKGSQIEKIEALEDFSLRVLFNNGCHLEIACKEFEEDPEYPCWEIHNAEFNMVLEVNERGWSYLESQNARF
jgi:hypothetical protein